MTTAGRAGRVRPIRRAALVLVLAAGVSAGLAAAELREETVAAWDRYTAATERRIAREIEDGRRFLVLDFLPDAARLRAELLAGDPVIGRMETRDERGERIDIPKGKIHHWRGAILVPNADVDHVVDSLLYRIPAHELQSDVVESRVLWREGNRVGTFLKLHRKSVVAMHYNTEHAVEYFSPGGGRAWSRSRSVRIAELDDFGSSEEREKPVGDDRGFLWRLNVYWRYQEVAGGVLMECEIVTLSRSIPFLMRWMVAPIVNREGRAAMLNMLNAMRTRLDPGPAAEARQESAPRVRRQRVALAQTQRARERARPGNARQGRPGSPAGASRPRKRAAADQSASGSAPRRWSSSSMISRTCGRPAANRVTMAGSTTSSRRPCRMSVGGVRRTANES